MSSNPPVAWPHVPFSEVRAYFYNEKGRSGVPILTEGRLHRTVINPEGALLSTQQIEQLTHALLAPHPRTMAAKCYYPRHAFVFRDAEQNVVATVGICFQCGTYSTVPGTQVLRPDWSALAGLIRELGLPLQRRKRVAIIRATLARFFKRIRTKR